MTARRQGDRGAFTFPSWMVIVAVSMCMVTVPVKPVACLDNGLGLVPPMGWSSWNSFVDVAMNETVIRETADAMVAFGLKDLGYEYLNVDCGWSALNRTSAGDIQPDPIRFPSGMQALSDYIHSKGLKFGLYTARGERECCGRLGYNGSEFATRDANMFAKWGVDYLKIDSCGADAVGTEWEQFAFMRDALNTTGRPVYLSICEIWGGDKGVMDDCHHPGVVYSPKMWFAEGFDAAQLGNSILVEFSNNGNSFKSVECTARAQELLTFDNLTHPGTWNDNDMLTTGCSDHHVNEPFTPCINKVDPMTHVEGRTEYTLFMIQAAPIILGNDLRHMTSSTLATLRNPEVIAVNQDKLGYRGRLVHKVENETVLVYVKLLSDNTKRALAVINLQPRAINIEFELVWLATAEEKVEGRSWEEVTLRDLWKQAPAQPLAHVHTKFALSIQAHGAILYTATQKPR